MAPHVACHIGLLWLRSRIHNLYTVPCGTKKKPKAQGGNGVKESFLPSPLLATMFLSFVPLPSIVDLTVLEMTGPTVCAPEQAEVFGRRYQNTNTPARSIDVVREGKRARVFALPS